MRVLTVCPSFTKTGLYDKTGVPGLAGRLLPMVSPQSVVDSALSAYDGGRIVKVVGLLNWLMTVSGAPTPRPILRWLMGVLFRPPQPALPPAG